MGAQMKITVEKTDGSKTTVSVLPKTIVAFERHFGVGLGALATESKMEHVFWLAWDASHVAGQVVKPFDDWLADVVDVEPEEDQVPLGSTTA